MKISVKIIRGNSCLKESLSLCYRFLLTVFIHVHTSCYMASTDNLTPMMKQFYDLKAKNPDAILLFRCGDFY